MKRMILLLVLALFSANESFAVKHSLLEQNKVTLHNFSMSSFDASNMKMTINNQWFAISTFTLISGTLIAPAGSDIVLGGFTLPLNGGSVALWYGSVDECNPSAFDMASYVQYGFAGNPFEALAASVSLWAAGAFVHGGPPLTRDNDWSSDGAQHWGGTILSISEKPVLQTIEIGPIPFMDRLFITKNRSSGEFSVEMFNILGFISYQKSAVKEDELEINTELLKQGVYFLRITDSEGHSLTRRILKNE